MSQGVLFKVCLYNIQKTLERIRLADNPDIQASAEFALGLLADLEGIHDADIKGADSACRAENPNDESNRNFDMYALLSSFGLSRAQLIAVADAQGLHEIRKLTMLRTVYSISLAEAQSLLAGCPE